jgi:hypothetical protein
MKKTLAISFIMVLFLSQMYSFARAGKGFIEGQQGGMMQRGQMIGDMMGITNQMSDMLSKLSAMLKDMPQDRVTKASELMKAMSHNMMEMSKIMKRGKASYNEMKELQSRMTNLQMRFSMMAIPN